MRCPTAQLCQSAVHAVAWTLSDLACESQLGRAAIGNLLTIVSSIDADPSHSTTLALWGDEMFANTVIAAR